MKVISTNNVPIKTWTEGVPFEEEAKQQLIKLASLPFIHKHIAVMPDVHVGKGSTIGTVIATRGAIIPAAVGVDIGCGMMAVKTSLGASDLPDNLSKLRNKIEEQIPLGFDPRRKHGQWKSDAIPPIVQTRWNLLKAEFKIICEKYPQLKNTNNIVHLGTLGSGNHFVELCLDTNNHVWVMLHSGSRGVGNAIGTLFIEKARHEMKRFLINLPDKDLAYLQEGSTLFDDYVLAVNWAQQFAALNREIMMEHVLQVLSRELKPFVICEDAVNCHHNYVQMEHHYGQNVWLTRKGAVSARTGQLGIIPGSMGAKSFIVRGLGNQESFHSCSHGAGRVMSRKKAKSLVNIDEHIKALVGVECRKNSTTLDETPSAYKDIDLVMKAQNDLVEIVYTLKQVLCIKG